MEDTDKATIYVSICAYRDLELRATIENCIRQASHPERLFFGICNQFDSATFLAESDFDNTRIVSVHYSKATGLGSARRCVQELYENQDFVLQLDSHMRFKPGWDNYHLQLHSAANQGGISRPIITAACPEWRLDGQDYFTRQGTKIGFKKFFERGTVEYAPNWLTKEEQKHKYVRGVFVSGHYYFAQGRFFDDYVFDPEIYFGGEETCLSVRAYTLGYDAIHPSDSYVYHAYNRSARNLHWLDHADTNNKNGFKIDVDKLDLISTKRIRQLLEIEDSGIDLDSHGLGQNRTLDQWIALSNVDIRNGRLLES